MVKHIGEKVCTEKKRCKALKKDKQRCKNCKLNEETMQLCYIHSCQANRPFCKTPEKKISPLPKSNILSQVIINPQSLPGNMALKRSHSLSPSASMILTSSSLRSPVKFKSSSQKPSRSTSFKLSPHQSDLLKECNNKLQTVSQTHSETVSELNRLQLEYKKANDLLKQNLEQNLFSDGGNCDDERQMIDKLKNDNGDIMEKLLELQQDTSNTISDLQQNNRILATALDVLENRLNT